MRLSYKKENFYIDAALAVLFISSMMAVPFVARYGIMLSLSLLAISLFCLKLVVWRMAHPNTLYLFAFIVFFIAHCLAIPASTEYAQDKRIYLLYTLLTTISFAYGARVNNENRILIGCLIIGFIYSCIQVFSPASEDNNRITEFGLNPLLMARMISLCFIASLFLFSSEKIVWAIPVAVFSLYALGLTGSRGPFISLLGAYFFYLAMQKRYYCVFLMFALAALSLYLLSFSVEYLPDQLSSRLSYEMLERQIVDPKSGDRLSLYKLALALFFESPLGIGFGNFSSFHFLVAPHNIYLEALVELGVLGFAWLALFVCYSAYCAIKVLRYSNKQDERFLFFVFIFFAISMILDGELTIQCYFLYFGGFFFQFKWSSLRFARGAPAKLSQN